MNTRTKIDTLWQELREAINKAYADYATRIKESGTGFMDDREVLRDYAENISWSDDLSALLGRETANERQHRGSRPTPKGFSAGSAAKCILMNNVRSGAQRTGMPKATDFLVLRPTAVEATVLGFILREYLRIDWLRSVNELDYSELMKAS